MKLYAPHPTLWWVAVITGLIGLLNELGVSAPGDIRNFAEGLPILSFLILFLATSIEGLQRLYDWPGKNNEKDSSVKARGQKKK